MTKLSENYVLYKYIILSLTTAMLNTLVKPNMVIECKPRKIFLSPHSQGIVSSLSRTLSYAFL